MLIRPATVGDSPALAAIYGHHVLHGSGTFEEVAPGHLAACHRSQEFVP